MTASSPVYYVKCPDCHELRRVCIVYTGVDQIRQWAASRNCPYFVEATLSIEEETALTLCGRVISARCQVCQGAVAAKIASDHLREALYTPQGHRFYP